MTMERTTMRKIREVLRLKYTHDLSHTQIGTSCNLSRECVRQYIKRAEKAGLSWPLPEEMSDAELERRLFKDVNQALQVPHPDWLVVHQVRIPMKVVSDSAPKLPTITIKVAVLSER